MKRYQLFFKCRNVVLAANKRHCKIIAIPHVFICKIINRSYRSGVPVSENVNAFIAPHGFNGIFVSKDAKIDKGCTIYQQVTIGSNYTQGSKHWGAPIIGENVFIGAGAKIIGGIKIGNNTNIGAGCIVSEDIPSNSTVVMSHPRIINRKRS